MNRLRWSLIALALESAVASAAPRGPKPDVIWVPTPDHVIELMLTLARVGPADVVYDLGSGDGRIVVAAAQRGARAVGVEIDPQRLRDAAERARTARVEGRARFVEGDLFKAELRDATVVTLYLLPKLNLRLRPRLLAELRPGARIVAHDFDMGDWEPDVRARATGPGSTTHDVYLWIVPARVAGRWLGPQGRFALDLEQRYQEVRGRATLDGRVVPLEEAHLAGTELRFTLRASRPVRFTGRIDGDRLDLRQEGGPTFVLQRAKTD